MFVYPVTERAGIFLLVRYIDIIVLNYPNEYVRSVSDVITIPISTRRGV